jgi:SAM-dependent methyltransferase
MTARLALNPSRWQRVADHVFFPLNMWLSEEASCRLGLTPIDHERVRMALPHCRGALLDVGCGNNLLVRSYGSGIGVDVHPYPEADALCDSCRLPFRSASFDTVALLACLNHIVRRAETLAECHRVLRPDGRIVLSMIPRWVGFFSHPIRERHDPDQLDRGMSAEEDWGLSTREIMSLLNSAGFRLTSQTRFLWGLNCVFVGVKTGAEG